MLLKPKNSQSNIIYKIEIESTLIKVLSPVKSQEFIDVIKPLGYKWHNSWQREISKFAGTTEDRATELACHLLANGFCIEIPDELKDKVLTQDYESEHKKWIFAGSGKFDNWFKLWWKNSGEDFWPIVRKYFDSRYDYETKCLHVLLDQYEILEDFAEVHDFRFSDKAKSLIDKAIEQQKEFLTCHIELKRKLEVKKIEEKLFDYSQFDDLPHRKFILKAKTELFEYQQKGIDKLLPVTIGALFMDMGTGKTRSAIELVIKRQSRISKVIWFCPVSLKDTIQYEIKKHTNTPDDLIAKFDKTTNIETINKDAFWYIIGLESMSSSDRMTLTANFLIDKNSFIIVDESSYIKGHNSIRTKRITKLAEIAKYRLILTGTPLSQGIVDLYAQMRFLSSNLLGYHSFYSFANNHLEYHKDYPGLIIKSHNVDWLASRINPFIYQITKEEAGLNLPEKLHKEYYFSLTGHQIRIYEKTKIELLSKLLEDEFNSYIIFELFTKLQQITSGFLNDEDGIYELDCLRLDVIKDIIEKLPDEKIVIWCKYIYSVNLIVNYLKDNFGEGKVSQFHGEIEEKQRSTELDKFRNDGFFFVATMATGGYGIDLTCSNYSIFYENDFKYQLRIQAEDRAHRIGARKNITYIDIFSNSGIEDRIRNAIAKKADVVKSFKQTVNKLKDKNNKELKSYLKKVL